MRNLYTPLPCPTLVIAVALLLPLLLANSACAQSPPPPRHSHRAMQAAPEPFNPLERLRFRLSSGSKRFDLVLYNRVPKSGSSTMQSHIDALSLCQGFKALHYARPPRVRCPKSQLPCLTSETGSLPTEKEVARLAEFFTSAAKAGGKPTLIDYHFRYVNFSSLNLTPPVYINTIRNPVSRIVSQYFYARYGPRSPEKRRKMIKTYGALSIDECIKLYDTCNCTQYAEKMEGPRSCQACTGGKCADLFYNLNTQMMYFCPWGSAQCTAKGAEALEEAKRVLQDQYEAVGILEHMEESLEVFEATLPFMFRGLSAKANIRSRVTIDKGDMALSEAAMKQLESMCALDMEFYRFSTQLLLGLHKRLADAGQLPKKQHGIFRGA